MKNYRYLANKQLKINKKRNIVIIFGIVMAVVLFILLEYINNFITNVNIQEIKNFNGNYIGKFQGLNINQLNYLKENVKIKNSGFLVLDGIYKIKIDGIEKNILNYSLDRECLREIFNKTINLEEGFLPNANKEILLQTKAKQELHKKIGDNIDIGNVNYKVVGFYKSKESNAMEFKTLSMLEDYKNYSSFYGFINLKEKLNLEKNILNIAKDIGIYNYSYDSNKNFFLNEILLHEEKQSKVISIGITTTIGFLIGFLIYVCINLSLKDRIRYLSILRCLGATSDKIKSLIIKENLIIATIALGIALILGHLLIYSFVNIVLKEIIKMNFYGVRLHISLKVILQVIFLTYLITTITSIIAYKKIIKPTPIEVLKNKGNNLKRLKLVKSNFFIKLFGYKGELAYKSIKSNNSSFLLITLLETSLLIVFVISTFFYISMFRNLNQKKLGSMKDFSITINSNLYDENTKLVSYDSLKKNQDLINNLKKDKEIKDVSSYMKFEVNPLFLDVKLNEHIKNNKEKYIEIPKSIMFVYDDEAFENLLPYVNGVNVNLKKFNENGIILININVRSNTLKYKQEPSIYVKSGEILKVYFKKLEENLNINNKQKDNNLNPIEFTVLGNINSKYISDFSSFNKFNGVEFIISKNFYEKNKNLLIKDGNLLNISTTIDFNFRNKNDLDIKKKIESYVDKIGGFYTDNYENRINEKRNLLGMSILVYTTIIFLWSIGIISFINNKNLSISLRREEFGIMRAIGMNKKDLKKLIILEGFIQWLIVSILGSILSYISIVIMSIFFNYSGIEIDKKIGFLIVIIGILCLLILNLTSVILPLRKFKNFDIPEMIKE